MNEPNPTVHLLERWKEGDELAATEIHRRYAKRLCAFAAGQLSPRLARREDAEDIVQSVFKTFFRRSRNGQFVLDGSNSLWQLLVCITLNKIRRKAEHHGAQRRDMAREQGLWDGKEPCSVADDEPGPLEFLILADELQNALTGFEEKEADMVGLFLQGYSSTEIAKELDVSRWTVRRVLDRVGARLRRRTDEQQ